MQLVNTKAKDKVRSIQLPDVGSMMQLLPKQMGPSTGASPATLPSYSRPKRSENRATINIIKGNENVVGFSLKKRSHLYQIWSYVTFTQRQNKSLRYYLSTCTTNPTRRFPSQVPVSTPGKLGDGQCFQGGGHLSHTQQSTSQDILVFFRFRCNQSHCSIQHWDKMLWIFCTKILA